MTVITTALYKIKNNDVRGESRSLDTGYEFVQSFGGRNSRET
jgi:hypothetical protein